MKYKYIKSVEIAGIKVPITYDTANINDELLGQLKGKDWDEIYINVAGHKTPDELESTLLHEIIHKITRETGILATLESHMGASVAFDFEEYLVRALEKHLHKLVTFRKELRK